MSCIAKKTSIVAATSELERLFSLLIYREYVSWKHYQQFTWVLMDHLADIAEGTKPGFRRENEGAQTTMYYFVCFFVCCFFFSSLSDIHEVYDVFRAIFTPMLTK